MRTRARPPRAPAWYTPPMETPRDDDNDRPDELDQVEELDASKFGELDDDRQQDEWEEDAREGGE